MNIILKYFSDFTQIQLDQFSALEPLYKEWNQKINVISRKDIDSLYEKHVLHSLSIAAVFEFADGLEIMDLGTGGGFPGIPLAIFFPHIKFVLVDSIAKKLKVAEAVATAIGLKNIIILHSRAEDIKNRKFDHIVSRAVAPLKDLWKWSRPLLPNQSARPGGQQVISYKHPATSPPDPVGNQQFSPSLICLKGGDLSSEILESATRPRVIEITEIFPEEFLKEKYLLFVPR